MTRKDYVKAAAIIRGALEHSHHVPEKMASRYYRQAARDIARDMADWFGEDNPRFDRKRFLEATGIHEDVHRVVSE